MDIHLSPANLRLIAKYKEARQAVTAMSESASTEEIKRVMFEHKDLAVDVAIAIEILVDTLVDQEELENENK